MKNMYEIEMKVDLENEFNTNEFNRELFKALPKDVTRMSYICSSCNEWMGSQIDSLCDLCIENYEGDLKAIEEDYATPENVEMAEYYKEKMDKYIKLHIQTKSAIDTQNLLDKFESGKYIKSISYISQLKKENVHQSTLEEDEVKISNDTYVFLKHC